MASKTLLPNPNCVNHITFQWDIWPRSHCFGQVKLPKKRKICSSRQSITTTNTAAATETYSTSLSRLWKEVQGSNNWETLIEPLHPLLRQEIIRYGEFATACYNAFDLNPNSGRYLNCKYGKKSILEEAGIENSGYQVTKYIYANPDINIPIQNGASCSRWIGYVAVSLDDATTSALGRRDILIAFRGTVTNYEWIANFKSSLIPARLDPHKPRPEVKVESGFLSMYTSDESNSKFGVGSCREQLLSEISRLLKEYKDEEVSITLVGHSMGSSLALLLSYDITELGLSRKNNPDQEVPVTVFSFAGPRVGNLAFKERCEELGVKVLRIVNVNDPITKLPGVLFNETFKERYEFPWSCSYCYFHVGVELVLDFFNMQNPICVHDLETYIDLLKSPQVVMHDHIERDSGVDFLCKAKELLLSAQNFSMLPWRTAASNMVSLAQSQGVESSFPNYGQLAIVEAARDLSKEIEGDHGDEEQIFETSREIGILAQIPTTTQFGKVIISCIIVACFGSSITFLFYYFIS